MLKGCGGGSDVCRSFAAYGTATKAEQMLNIELKLQSPKTFLYFHPNRYSFYFLHLYIIEAQCKKKVNSPAFIYFFILENTKSFKKDMISVSSLVFPKSVSEGRLFMKKF